LRYAPLPIEVVMLDADSRQWFSGIVGRAFEEWMPRYQDVRSWGLAQEPELRRLLRRLAGGGARRRER
jgi:hypothetical protein